MQATAMFVGLLLLTPVAGGAPDLTLVTFTCVDTGTGGLMWQHMRGYPKAASSPLGRGDISRAFLFLPDMGRPLQADCEWLEECEMPLEKPRPELAGQPEAGSRGLAGCVEPGAGAPVWECGLGSFYREPWEVKGDRPSLRKAFRRRYWYIGLGSLSGKISGEHPSFAGESGSGEHIVLGYKSGRLSGELNIGGFDIRARESPPEVYYPPDDANYSFFSFGMKFDILDLDRRRFSPWLAVDLSIQDIGFKNYVYSVSGSCISPGVGLDVMLARWLVLRAGASRCSFSASSSSSASYRTRTTTYTVDAIFRLPRY